MASRLCHALRMNRQQLSGAKKLRARARDLKLKAEGLIREADELIRQAEELERKETKPKRQREDVNQAAFRVVRESTE